MLPLSAITGLSTQQLDALIIHELAHIRRLDPFANILLIAVETALFYHPAVWWVGRRIRTEREHCCDDIAVTLSGDASAYVEALATLENLRVLSAPILAATGGNLRDRAARLLGITSKPRTLPFVVAASLGGAFLLLLLALAIGNTVHLDVHVYPVMSARATEGVVTLWSPDASQSHIGQHKSNSGTNTIASHTATVAINGKAVGLGWHPRKIERLAHPHRLSQIIAYCER